MGEAIGLSEGKKLDFRRRGEGEGGICDSVSMVRSDKDGLGFRRAVSALAGNGSSSGPDPRSENPWDIEVLDEIGWVDLEALSRLFAIGSCGFSHRLESLNCRTALSGMPFAMLV